MMSSFHSEEANLLVRLVTNASLSEIRAWVKPGNVHRTHDFPSTKYEDFLTVAYGLREKWFGLYESLEFDKEPDFAELSKRYTEFLMDSTKFMMDAQKGGNVLLGHLMLLPPLFITAAFAKNKGFSTQKEFWDFCNNIIQNSTPEDTIRLYKALRIAAPGGMGQIKRYDINNENAFNEIIEDNVNLGKIFSLSSERDMISNSLSNNYKFIREEILPKLETLSEDYSPAIKRMFEYTKKKFIYKDVIDISLKFNELLIRLYIYILSIKPDSLIIRKCGDSVARKISHESQDLYDNFFIMDRSFWFNEVNNFDLRLQKKNGKFNPGTTADLLAATIFIMYGMNSLNL